MRRRPHPGPLPQGEGELYTDDLLTLTLSRGEKGELFIAELKRRMMGCESD